ncbi:MAG: hypothetical protein RL380_934, partial [Verrucomicrobiota bacterium]
MPYKQSNQRVRLAGRTQSRSAQVGLSTAGAFLFGLPFVGVGVFVMLMGLKIISVEPSKLHAPHWVLTMFGVCFLAAGIFLWSMGWRQFRANQRRIATTGGGLAERALADFAWDKRGFRPSRWAKPVRGFSFSLFLAVFLSMFNWWAFGDHGPF